MLGPAAPPPHIQIDLVFTGERIRPKLKAAVMEETTAIWAAHHVEIQETTSADAARGDGAIKLAVAVAYRTARNVNADALGSIYFVDGTPTAAIILYPNTISGMIQPSMLLGPGVHERSPFAGDRILGRVMGRALAHEIGHYLLRSRYHSDKGLMRATPQITELIDQDRRGFHLTTSDVARLTALLPVYSSASDDVTPALQETALGGVVAPCDREVVGDHRLLTAAEPLQEVGADRVKQVIPIEVETIDQRQRGVRSVDLRHRNRAVQRDDWAGCDR
jgi:hypothetical protein